MKNKLISLRYAAATLCCAASLVSCGGNSKDSGSNNTTQEGGLAPTHIDATHIDGDVLLTPMDATVAGTIRLTDTDARVATFTTPMGVFTGNYTYTKCGPDIAELKLDNVRMAPIQAPSDQHWTIIGYITFFSANQVVFAGTETFVASGVGEGGSNSQSPMGTSNFSLNYTFTMGN